MIDQAPPPGRSAIDAAALPDAAGGDAAPEVSIVAPMKNEAGNVTLLVEEIGDAMAGISFEVVLVDDGSTDATAQTIRDLAATRRWLRLVQHPASGGQSAAVHSGVLAARAPLVCTLDGDGQNPPAELPRLVAAYRAAPGGTGLVAGQRVGRQDTASKKLASRLANRLRAAMLNDDTRDSGCGLKCFPRETFLRLPYFDHMHRYLPALVKREGLGIVHLDVSHRERGSGRSNYTNLGRALVGIYDLIGVAWLIKRRKKARPTDG